jgi:hypothetical protein
MSSGYLKHKCDGCGKKIYLKQERYGRYIAYESWVDGSVDKGEWVLHRCGVAASSNPETLPTNPASSNRPGTQVPPVQIASEASLGDFCRQLQSKGINFANSLDILAKMASILDAIRAHCESPEEMVAEMCRFLERQKANNPAQASDAKAMWREPIVF